MYLSCCSTFLVKRVQTLVRNKNVILLRKQKERQFWTTQNKRKRFSPLDSFPALIQFSLITVVVHIILLPVVFLENFDNVLSLPLIQNMLYCRSIQELWWRFNQAASSNLVVIPVDATTSGAAAIQGPLWWNVTGPNAENSLQQLHSALSLPVSASLTYLTCSTPHSGDIISWQISLYSLL